MQAPMRGVASCWVVVVVVTGLACAPAPPTPDAGPAWWDAALAPCVALRGAEPATVDDVLALLNRLPQPATLPCFVAALPRPLRVVATTSQLSAQPAQDAQSPRVFAVFPKLVLGVVPEGSSAKLLELAEYVTETRSLKGELVFPLPTPVTRKDAFEHLAFQPTASRCGLCHRDEARVGTETGTYVSEALRHEANTDVPLAALQALVAACEATPTTPRCLTLAGLVAAGPATQAAFPTSFQRFFP